MARITDSSDQFLAHYGIPGMKWGKRKAKGNMSKSEFLNPKATPFPRTRPPYTPKGVTDLSPKPIKKITDKELRERLNRIQMETQYKDLTEPKPKTATSKATEVYNNFEKGHSAVKKLMAVAKTAQSIYKLYDSNESRMLRGVESKEAEAERKKKNS